MMGVFTIGEQPCLLFHQSNKMLQTGKAFSKSLKKFINKTNPEHRQVSLYFQRSQSSAKVAHPVLPVLPAHGQAASAFRRRANSQKVRTEPAESEPSQLELNQQPNFPAAVEAGRSRQSLLSEKVDDIMYGLIERGEATVGNLKGMRDSFEKKRLKNLRIATEVSEPRPAHKRSQAYEQVELLALNKEISRERLLRRKFLLENPQVEKKVSTRRGKEDGRGPTKDMLSYYPLADLRQENQELLLNLPAKSEEFIRKLRQTALHKLKHY